MRVTATKTSRLWLVCIVSLCLGFMGRVHAIVCHGSSTAASSSSCGCDSDASEGQTTPAPGTEILDVEDAHGECPLCSLAITLPPVQSLVLEHIQNTGCEPTLPPTWVARRLDPLPESKRGPPTLA